MLIIDAMEYISKMKELHRYKVRLIEMSAMVDYYREKCYSMEKEYQRKKSRDDAERANSKPMSDSAVRDLFGGIFK